MPWLSCILSNVVLASLLALVAWLVQRSLRWQEVARILWILVLVKLITPSFASVPLHVIPATVACRLGVCGCGSHGGPPATVWDALSWSFLATWSVGAAVASWSAWRHWTGFRRLMAHASPASPEWQSLAERLSSELSIWRPPEILMVPGRLPPLVVPGFRRSRVLLPLALVGQLDAPQRDALLLHELIHIKRGDQLVRLFESAVSVVYWWLPVVGSIGRQLRVCEETSCDAAVVAHLPHARRDYARLLLDVIDFANPLPRHVAAQVTAMSAANDLEQRLRSILDSTQGTRRSWPVVALTVGLACAVVPCQFQYDSVGRRAPATDAGCGPVTETTTLLGGDRVREMSVAFCCPI